MVKIVIDMPDLYDTNEAAQILGIGYATVYRWIKAGKLIPVRVDKRTLIPKSELQRVKNEAVHEQAAEKPAA